MRWGALHIASLQAALDSALAGRPAVLVVTGEAGMGKSAFLDDVVARANGFSVIRADCLPLTTPLAYGTVQRRGVVVESPSDLAAVSLPLAGQRLRALVDERLSSGPLLILVDDLQWVDVESVEVLLSVIDRAEGERLLLCMAVRPLRPGRHAAFQSWQRRSRGLHSVALDGLDAAEAAELLRTFRPAMSSVLVESLWKHTGGNPLYLRALADEYDDVQLAGMRVLPAPAEFAATVTSRLSRVSSSAVTLARAAAVLGGGWHPLPDVAAVAQVQDPAAAAEELVVAGIGAVRSVEPGLELRLAHALVRAAIYQDVPLPTCSGLHDLAAA